MRILHHARRAAAAVAAVCAVSTAASLVPSQVATAAAGSPSFSVVGNRIMESNGKQFVPYGFVAYCLSEPNLSCNSNINADRFQITNAASLWHANTVRIQTAWEHLFESNGSVNSAYLADIDSEVAQANHLGMVAIITLQTERYGGSLMPDANALRFWKVIASHYAGNPDVFFDLFNEPRYTAPLAVEWQLWQSGGEVLSGGRPVSYVGMQQLVDTVRGAGANNIVIAEGVGSDHDLSGLPTHALRGSNIAYGDEPSLRSRGNVPDATPAQWKANWGNLAATYPIMMEAFIDDPSSEACNPQSPNLVPQLLSYLQSLHLGMIYWSLQPGIAIVGYNYANPTSFSGPSYNCSAPMQGNVQGPGQLIRQWFLANSSPV